MFVYTITLFFPLLILHIEAQKGYCPGGGAVVVASDGRFAKCDYFKSCRRGFICNPILGICCTKLRTCPKPMKTMVSSLTMMPIMCRMKGGQDMPCPESGRCEASGFCCQQQEDNNGLPPATSDRPWRNERCTPQEGCNGGAACVCTSRDNCRCECPTEIGYSVGGDGKTCQRVRRRLKEKCKSDMECSAAYSECTTGGCRCKTGFQRDGNMGCKPIEHRCATGSEPLKKSSKVVSCSVRHMQETHGEEEGNEDSCPSDYYCIPVFDDATKLGYYQGFCCRRPSERRMMCPVGEAHPSSSYPDYGCSECPADFFCHRDPLVTDHQICCPKPCVSLEDIYHDGQCYSIAFHGDSCHLDSQCQYASPVAEDQDQVAKLECTKGQCLCPPGFAFTNGHCSRVMCRVGLRGEPSFDRFNNIIKCSSSDDCSQGQMCDPRNKMCCKGLNRCPKNYVETGDSCTTGNCVKPNEICHWPKNGKTKLCCVLDGQ